MQGEGSQSKAQEFPLLVHFLFATRARSGASKGEMPGDWPIKQGKGRASTQGKGELQAHCLHRQRASLLYMCIAQSSPEHREQSAVHWCHTIAQKGPKTNFVSL